MLDLSALPKVRALIEARAVWIACQDDELNDHRVLIEKLKLQIARLRRLQFGQSSERLDAELAQLTLALEELEAGEGERGEDHAQDAPAPPEAAAEKPAGRPLPDHQPRTVVEHQSPCACPRCGGALRHVRAKLSCRACEAVVQVPAADLPIRRGHATAGLLAHVLVAKYADHLPLYRQSEIYAREGVELEGGHARRLGRAVCVAAAAAGGRAREARDGRRPHPRRRHARSGARAGHGRTKTGRL